MVESIPEGLTYPEGSPSFLSTYDAWNILIDSANKSIDLGSFYWTLRGADFYNHSSAWQVNMNFISVTNPKNNLLEKNTDKLDLGRKNLPKYIECWH